ncbi:2945_t:CDS:2, partial [Scutellospora calospora]
MKQFTSFAGLVVVYGSIRYSIIYIPFYQRNIESYSASSLTTVGSVALVTNISQYNDLEREIKNISQIYKTYIGFTYVDASINGNIYNKLTVVSPNGNVLNNYAKSNLVPFIESQIITAGPNVLQTSVTSDFGIIGGAICFDYDFPSLIGQASKNNVDFMIQPSNTW